MVEQEVSANMIYGFFDYAVHNQESFNQLFSKIAEGEYEFIDDIKSIYYSTGTYSIPDMLTYHSDVSTTITIDANAVVSRMVEHSTTIDWTGITGVMPFVEQMGGGVNFTLYEDIFTATQDQTVFEISQTVGSDEALAVFVNAAYQAKDTFTVVNNVLTLNTGCDLDDKVVVRISVLNAPPEGLEPFEEVFTATQGQTVFTLTNTPANQNSLLVVVAAATQTKDDYGLAGNIVTLDTGCDADDVVMFKGYIVASVTTPGDNSVSTAKIQDDAVTEDKIADIVANGLVPVGCIISWIPGYFGDGDNGSYTDMSGSVPISSSYKECNGLECNDSGSPIFNGVGRHLPNLTSDRFLMGNTVVGSIGGYNAQTLTTANMAPHTHTIDHDHPSVTNGSGVTISGGAHDHDIKFNNVTEQVGGGVVVQIIGSGSQTAQTESSSTHDHTITVDIPNLTSVDSGTLAAASSFENRPAYLSCKYIMRIK